MGWLRAGVGVGLVVFPARFLRLSGREAPTAVSILLMRTIGIQTSSSDWARSPPPGAVTTATCAVGRRPAWPATPSTWAPAWSPPASIGTVEAAGAAAAALLFAVGDTLVLSSLGGQVRPDPDGQRVP